MSHPDDRTPEGTEPILRRNDDQRRYELWLGDVLVGLATFIELGGIDLGSEVVVIPHTEIDPARRGHGLGALMVRAVLDDLAGRGRRVRPDCPFVADFIDLHPEYRPLVAS